MELGVGACAAGASWSVFSPRWHTAASKCRWSAWFPAHSHIRVVGGSAFLTPESRAPLLSHAPLSCPPFCGRPATSDPTDGGGISSRMPRLVRPSCSEGGVPLGGPGRLWPRCVPIAADTGGRLWAGPQWARKTGWGMDRSMKGQRVGATSGLGEPGEWGYVRDEIPPPRVKEAGAPSFPTLRSPSF